MQSGKGDVAARPLAPRLILRGIHRVRRTAVRVVLFHRNYQTFAGGHLKVWHYFQHVRQAEEFEPFLYCSPTTKWDETNPWIAERHRLVDSWDAIRADVWFLAGLDW